MSKIYTVGSIWKLQFAKIGLFFILLLLTCQFLLLTLLLFYVKFCQRPFPTTRDEILKLLSISTWASRVVLELKNLSANAGDARDLGLIPGLGRGPEGGNGNSLQYSCLENSMDRGALRTAAGHVELVLWRVGHNWTTK